MREVQINRNLILREDGKLFNVKTGKEFIPKSNCKGYLSVRIYGRIHKLIHVLVMECFGAPKPGPKYQVDHIDRNILNNDIKNLRWVTQTENNYNKINNRPIGKRKCDCDSKIYVREYMREYMREYKK